MANLRMTLGQVNIVDHMIIRLRLTTAPLAVVASESYAPPHPTTRNVVVPASGSIAPDEYYIDVYESSDGITLGLLLGQFIHKITDTSSALEWRFYKVGNGDVGDPDPGSVTLTDPYLAGKSLSAVFKQGYGPLTPDPYTFKEYDFATDTITLLGGQIFSNEEIVAILLENPTAPSGVSGGSGIFSNVITLTTSTSINSTHYNARLRCEDTGSTIQVHTLPDAAAVPEGTIFYFMQNQGANSQTKILCSGANTIRLGENNYPEVSIGKGEWIHIEKRTISSVHMYEVVGVHAGVEQVGERFSAGTRVHPNCKPEDGTLYDGDQWPRIWYWITNVLPADHVITDDTVTNGGYAHPTGKVGQFVRHSSLKKFRVPNTQNITERGIKTVAGFGTDTTRVYDYPGGMQNESVAPHIHSPLYGDNAQHSSSSSSTGSPSRWLVNNNADNNTGEIIDSVTGPPTGNPIEARVKNIAVVYTRRF